MTFASNKDKYYPVDDFLHSIKKYDVLLDFSNVFFYNLKLKPTSRTQFDKLMKSPLIGEHLVFILDVLTYLSMHSIEFRKFNIIDSIISDEFYNNLVRHTYNLHENRLILENSISNEFSILVKFYEAIIFYLPVSELIYEKMFVLFDMTYECMKIVGRCDLAIYERIKALLVLLQDISNSSERNNFFYKELSMFPNEVNLYEKHNLLPSIVRGPYENSEEYLDIHFKLLREDFFEAVREDLNKFKKQRVGIKVNKNYDVYRNVKSIGNSYKNYKICHTIQFSAEDKKLLKRVNWEVSKKFMNGALLFFSKNNFTTFVIATIETNFCAISEGHHIALQVSVIGNPNQIENNSEYDMLEPSSFFQPYYSSLKMLKSINPFNFPFAEDIIKVSKQFFPSPLKETNISTLLKDVKDLNKSQLDALKACLSQKFTLIQGPPGTGKSYLTRKLVTLLANDTNDSRSILVICMRNRSLDIILEPLVRSGLKVLRFGKTDSDVLERYTFTQYREQRGWNTPKFSSSAEVVSFIGQSIITLKKMIKNPKCKNNPEAVEAVYQLYNKAGDAMRLHNDYLDAFKISTQHIQVIGSTTASAAKRNRLLSQLKPKIVIIEEAAEILESFAISSIPSSCDHLVLIGDHKQLQPITRIDKYYKLDRSLFERLVMNGKGYNTLNIQHRMRPEIAELICPLIYEDLENHESVKRYPNISGIASNLYFINHSANEEFQKDCLSYVNPHEGNLVLSFANYMVKQGYKATEIAVLAAYSAQLSYLIKNSVNYPRLTDMPIQTIDNYQGDENFIILLSLVRSNGQTIGFLSRANRVNVALSRAKYGLYLFGNLDTLTKCSQIWIKIRNVLKKRKYIGNSLPLCCKTHKKITLVSKPEEINSLEYGGCNNVCNLKLECGHNCTLPCHANVYLHYSTPCKKPCLRKQCGFHNCNKKCYEDCGICRKPRQSILKCGHTKTLECFANPDDQVCVQPCKRMKSCGLHMCNKRCFETCGPCKANNNFPLKCGHTATLPCSSNISTYKCLAKCKRKSCSEHNCIKLCHEECQPCEKNLKFTLKCGHTATHKCNEDLKNYKCSEQCNRILSCGLHTCGNKCSDACEKICKKTSIKLLSCGHMGVVPCEDPEFQICIMNCASMRPCGIHECTNGCIGRCNDPCLILQKELLACGHYTLQKCCDMMNLQSKRVNCMEPCNKTLICGEHVCKRVCHFPFPCSKCHEWKKVHLFICGHEKMVPCGTDYKEEINKKCDHMVRYNCESCDTLLLWLQCHQKNDPSFLPEKKTCDNCNKSICIIS